MESQTDVKEELEEDEMKDTSREKNEKTAVMKHCGLRLKI